MARHLTDRKDWTFIAECVDGGKDHLRIEASAKAADKEWQNPSEIFPIDECPKCGADMAFIQKDEYTEVIE